MARSVVFTRAAARALNGLPTNTESSIRDKLRQFAADPQTLMNNVKKGGDDRYRPRIGDWRAIFMIEADRIIGHDVGPRGSIYG